MRLYKIGRDVSCDIVINSPKVSSLHAELTALDSGDYMIEDKGSHNGTYVMGNRVNQGASVKVSRGIAIRLGDVDLNWGLVPPAEDNSAYSAIYSIGSHRDNRIVIPGATVSRYHAAIKISRNRKKAFLVDYSKNGTSVDGVKIPANNPIQIWRESVIVCGGVPVPINTIKDIPSRGGIVKKLLAIAASIVLIAAIGFGGYTIWNKIGGKQSDDKLYANYSNSTVMLLGIYHYEVSCGNMSQEDMAKLGIPIKILPIGKKYMQIDGTSQSELVDFFINPDEGMKGQSQATGFFISSDGQIITNLHVVKPWLFDGSCELLQDIITEEFSVKVSDNNYVRHILGQSANTLGAYIPKIKVEGKLDYVALVPQGQIFDKENIFKCKVVSAGEDTNKDVALIQTVTHRMPTADCKVINVKDSMDISEEAIKAGKHIYTIGFPAGTRLQDEKNEQGIQVFGNGGNITQSNQEYQFAFDAASTHGSSGSAIFNDRGMLVGVLNSGIDAVQGFNYGIKAKYVKELLDAPHKQ